MKRVDRLILKELVGPWAFGVGMFTVLIVAGTYLFRITDYFVQGVAFGTIMELTAMLMPGVMVKTFAMALLLAGLLAFGRLSSDSEIIALRAAGTTIQRMIAPVAIFSLAIALLSFWMNETLVPAAATRTIAIQKEIAQNLRSSAAQPLAQAQFEKGRLVAKIDAADFDLMTRTLRDVTITSYDERGKPNFVMLANELRYEDEKNWKIVGGGRLLAVDGTVTANLNGDVWPPEVPVVTINPRDLLSPTLKNMDAFTIRQFIEQIERAKQSPHVSKGQIANLEYGLWNKFALPLVALVYGLLGAPLGIRNVRTGAATGFAVSIAIIFAYITIANLMNVYAMGGLIPAYAASFTPLAIGLACAGVIIWRRNR